LFATESKGHKIHIVVWIQLGANVNCGPPSPPKGAALPIALQPQREEA